MTPSTLKNLARTKNRRLLDRMMAEVRDFFPNGDSVGCREAFPVLVSRACAARGGRSGAFISPRKDGKAEGFYDPEQDESLQRYLRDGGRDIYLATGLDPHLPFFVFERAVNHPAGEWGASVTGFSPRFLSFAPHYYLTPEQALARLVVAGLSALGDEPFPGGASNPGDTASSARAAERLAKPLNPWLNISECSGFDGAVRRAERLRRIMKRRSSPVRPAITSVTVCCFDHSAGVNRCTLDGLELAKILAAVRLLLKDVPYLCLNTGGFSRSAVETALLYGYNDLGILLPEGLDTNVPFLEGNLTLEEGKAPAEGLGLRTARRGVDFLSRSDPPSRRRL